MVLGLLAGSGSIPEVIARNAKAQGHQVVAVALESLTDPSLKEHADTLQWFNPGKLGSMIQFLKDNGVRKAVTGGKLSKELFYTGRIKPDLMAIGVFMKLRDKRDDTIIRAVEQEFEKEGISFLDMKDFCSELLTPEGTLTARGPDTHEKDDIEFGFRMAKEIGSLDIGQTVVVKDRAVMAVEAIEGTDEAIRRGGTLAGGGAVVVKVSRPGQDMRTDVPVVGLQTLSIMDEEGVRVLALEAGKSMVLDREEFLAKADGAGITVVGVSADNRS
jgi:DUF1009 family protein